MGYYIQLNCSVSGNPKPRIQWYRNGELIQYDLLINYTEPKLIIRSYEEYHKGIYQCIATNVAGEAQVVGLLSWKIKDYLEQPQNVKCYPINYSTLKVTYQTERNYPVSSC